MARETFYRNADLDLSSFDDSFPALIQWFHTAQMGGYGPQPGAQGGWFASVSMMNADEPESNIADMLTLIEALPEPLRVCWDNCTLREFNIGYDCGTKPWALQHRLSAALLVRIAAVGASIGLTLYAYNRASAR